MHHSNQKLLTQLTTTTIDAEKIESKSTSPDPRGTSFSDGLEDVRKRIHTYQSERVRDEQDFIDSAIHFGCGCLSLGLALAVAGSAFELLGNIISLIGSGLFLLGIFVLTLCPHEEHGMLRVLSFDGSMRENHGVWTAGLLLVVLLGALSFFGKISIPWLSPAGSLPALLGLVLGKSVHKGDGRVMPEPDTPRSPGEWYSADSSNLSLAEGINRKLCGHVYPSAFAVVTLLLSLAGHGLEQIGVSIDSSVASAMDEDHCHLGSTLLFCRTRVLAGIFHLAASIAVFVAWLRHRKLTIVQQTDDSNRTKALFLVVYAYMVCTGIGSIINSVGLGVEKWQDIVDGVVWLALPITILVLGQKRTVRLIRPFFEKKRAKQDGAFIAELLDTVMVPPGGTWYVLRKEPAEQYDHNDFRRHWRRGTVERVSRHHMVVSVFRRRQSRERLPALLHSLAERAIEEGKSNNAPQSSTHALQSNKTLRKMRTSSVNEPSSPTISIIDSNTNVSAQSILDGNIRNETKLNIVAEEEKGPGSPPSERTAYLLKVFRASVKNGGVEQIRNRNEVSFATRSHGHEFRSTYTELHPKYSPDEASENSNQSGKMAPLHAWESPNLKSGRHPTEAQVPRRNSFAVRVPKRSSFLKQNTETQGSFSKPLQRGGSFRKTPQRRSSFAITPLRRRSDLFSGFDNEKVVIEIANVKSSDVLLKEAEANLRCIAWEDIDRDLMGTSHSSPNDFNRSRPLRKGEKIDFFMSHSWTDDPELKFAALERAVARFRRKNGRSPTFWLDKVCIDQSRIIDGLKVLPINIAACNKVLVLCGDTYPSRLWCIWELFTLFAFSNEDDARARIEFEPVRKRTGEGALTRDTKSDANVVIVPESLKHFQLARAHCFDPNEEKRLRGIIEARGIDVFENRISDLAFQCEIAISENRFKGISRRRSRLVNWGTIRAVFQATSSFNSFSPQHDTLETKPDKQSCLVDTSDVRATTFDELGSNDFLPFHESESSSELPRSDLTLRHPAGPSPFHPTSAFRYTRRAETSLRKSDGTSLFGEDTNEQVSESPSVAPQIR